MGQTGGEWFAAWFDSPYYPVLYCHRNEAEACFLIHNIVSHLKLDKGAKVLDLACGSGRHALEFANLGMEVVGIDLSEQAIARANESAQGKAEFFVHDMRQLFWNRHFNLVVNLFTSYGYFHNKADDMRVMQSVHDALAPGGYFIMDYLNAKRVVAQLVQSEQIVRNGIQFKIERRVERNMVTKHIEVVDGSATHFYKEEVDLLTESDLTELMEDAGFTVIGLYGDYALGPYSLDQSERLVILAQRFKP